jgi:predicted RNA polymerase sigma factor
LAQRRAACRRGDRLDEIIEWYVELVRLTDSAGAGLNLAVTVGEADGPRAGLAALPRPAPPPPPRRTCTIVTVTH